MYRFLFPWFLITLFFSTSASAIEILDLTIIPYERLVKGDPETLQLLNNALYENGIVGISGVPGYKELYANLIKAAVAFHALPISVKKQYIKDTYIGYVCDYWNDSYYALIPDSPKNTWPREEDLKTPFEALGNSVAKTGELILSYLGLDIDKNTTTGRLLIYTNDHSQNNPHWCGMHFDKGLFTALMPAIYFKNGEQILEPIEAGLFVRISKSASFKKVIANDLDVMLFQVGELGEFMSDHAIRAPEHYVSKSMENIDRYTFALFYNTLVKESKR